VHCRGGVGRAGLFACCWLLKLGLCGRLERGGESEPGSPRSGSSGGGSVNGNGNGKTNGAGVMGARRDAMDLIERVVRVVRRRRSLKAIETYEQVRFLIDFVEFLRASESGSDGDGDGSGGEESLKV